MRSFKLFLATMFLYSIICSCAKEKLEIPDTEPITFRLDGTKIEGALATGEYQYLVITPRVIETGFINDHYYYSTKEGYIDHGNKLGYDFNRLLSFEQDNRNYLDEHPELQTLENKDDIPLHYLNFIDGLVKKYSKTETHERVLTNFYNRCDGGYLNSMPAVSVNPWYLPNNRVTAIEFFALTGVTDLFDKRFYVARTATLAYPGGGINQGPHNLNCLEGTQANNNTSSVLNLSI